MQSEIIYVPSAKIILLEELNNSFNANIFGNIIKIKNIEKLGKLFNFMTNHTYNDSHFTNYKPEKIFQSLIEPIQLVGYLEDSLMKAEIQFTLAKKEDNKPQYLGLTYGKPTNFHCKTKVAGSSEWESKRSIIPCQLYLIKDDLK